MTDEPTSFARWLDATMQTRGLSQAQVARQVGVADAQVSRWRRGQVTPSVRYLQQIANTFDVPRTNLERMAGYPMSESELPGEVDPALEAEIESYQARFRRLLEERVSPELWRAYLDACEVLADRLSTSFMEVADEMDEKQRASSRPMGFRTEERRPR